MLKVNKKLNKTKTYQKFDNISKIQKPKFGNKIIIRGPDIYNEILPLVEKREIEELIELSTHRNLFYDLFHIIMEYFSYCDLLNIRLINKKINNIITKSIYKIKVDLNHSSDNFYGLLEFSKKLNVVNSLRISEKIDKDDIKTIRKIKSGVLIINTDKVELIKSLVYEKKTVILEDPQVFISALCEIEIYHYKYINCSNFSTIVLKIITFLYENKKISDLSTLRSCVNMFLQKKFENEAFDVSLFVFHYVYDKTFFRVMIDLKKRNIELFGKIVKILEDIIHFNLEIFENIVKRNNERFVSYFENKRVKEAVQMYFDGTVDIKEVINSKRIKDIYNQNKDENFKENMILIKIGYEISHLDIFGLRLYCVWTEEDTNFYGINPTI